MFRGKLITPLN